MGIKYFVNENFFEKWSDKMAYILGYLYADGSMEDASYLRGKYVRVSSTDEDSVVKIKRMINSGHTIVKQFPKADNRKIRYLLRIGSHKLYDDLTKLGLYPNKSLTVKFPKIPKKYLPSFILGYFDGDGCVRVARSKNKNGTITIKKLSTVFTCGSELFLKRLAKNIKENTKIKHVKVYNGHRSYMLAYSSADSIELFKFLYGGWKEKIFLERKFFIFCGYLELKTFRIDTKVKKIFNRFYSGRVAK